MAANFDHSRNTHSIEGPRTAFGKILSDDMPASILDVGCGIGTWLRVALDHGIQDIFGLDGVDIHPDQLLIPRDRFRREDLTRTIDLGRRFSVVLCLEVAEHLDEQYACNLIDTLTSHSEYILFSAACPGQPGQNHLNCQWPAWWQRKFNDRGYRCHDETRWMLWEESNLEPWYRQNLFVAFNDPIKAGREPRLKAVIHPDMIPYMLSNSGNSLADVASGNLPILRSTFALLKGVSEKIRRRVAHRSLRKR
jgi:SAM-dependent methyltransferase